MTPLDLTPEQRLNYFVARLERERSLYEKINAITVARTEEEKAAIQTEFLSTYNVRLLVEDFSE